MITLAGISRYRITKQLEGFTPYIRCDVSWEGFSRDMGGIERDESFERAPFLDLLGRFFAMQNLSTDWDSIKEAEDELLVNSLAMLLPFDPEDKQALLEAPSLTTRRETLVTLIEFALRRGSDQEVMQ
jgi:Lon protease-like protein